MHNAIKYKDLPFCVKLKMVRELRGYTVKEIASELDITPRAYLYYESGKVDITISKLNLICSILSCTVDDIVSFDPSDLFHK